MDIVFSVLNECETENGGCQHICVDTFDGYCCMCEHGYKLVPLDTGCNGKVLLNHHT